MTTILYRSSLATCNYTCKYCPFSGRSTSQRHLEADIAGIQRFVAWVNGHAEHVTKIFFTPQGEVLQYKHYQQAASALTHKGHKTVFQTNLSCDLGWLKNVRPEYTALWCTFHPSQIDMATFLNKCKTLCEVGICFSVGMVGVKENFEAIRQMREALNDSIYLWVNAFKRTGNYYSFSELKTMKTIDPLFGLNLPVYQSYGELCNCGSSVFTVDEAGDVRQCHFSDKILANIYVDDGLPVRISSRCPVKTCHCHIGYVHLKSLQLQEVYGDGILERIPVSRL